MISTERLSDLFVDVADTLVADFDVVDFLITLCEHATLVSGADAVGIVLTDHRGELRFMASSNEAGRELELAQLQARGGPLPGLRADQGAGGQHRPQRRQDDLWPTFAPSAIDAGFHSVHAFPMRLREQVIGALNLFSVSEMRFEPREVRVVQSLADVATIAILQERSIARAEALTEQLQGALNSRIVIEQAKGALARRTRASASTRRSRDAPSERGRSRQRLVDVAATVLAAD